MSDSPVVKAPLDPAEKPILDNLLLVRDKLLLLKQDKTQYVKSQDVTNLYDEIIVQIEKLNDIRTHKKDEQNRLDTVLDDCLQLVSLFFMTVGRNNEAPAAYSLVSTIKRLLDHLKEAGFFTRKDLDGTLSRMNNIEESFERGKNDHNKHVLILLEARIETCRIRAKELYQATATISPELLPLHEKLVSILRSLSGLNTRSKFPAAEVQEFQKQIQEIGREFNKGKSMEIADLEGLTPKERLDRYADKIRHLSYDEQAQQPGEEIVRDLIERNTLWADIVMERKGQIDPRFRETYDNLLSIRNQLDKLALTQAWSLRETDLYSYQRKLDRIDEARDIEGRFLDCDGGPCDLYEQRTLLYLLRKSYANIYNMLTSSEPVSEALLPIYNQLTTLRKCLVEVRKSGGVSSPRELYPYSMKLNSIDNMRQDGKFIVNGDIPEGQGSVISILSECFEMAYELRNDAEQAEQDNDSDDDDRDDDDSGVQMGRGKNTGAEKTESAKENPISAVANKVANAVGGN